MLIKVILYSYLILKKINETYNRQLIYQQITQ